MDAKSKALNSLLDQLISGEAEFEIMNWFDEAYPVAYQLPDGEDADNVVACYIDPANN